MYALRKITRSLDEYFRSESLLVREGGRERERERGERERERERRWGGGGGGGGVLPLP